jgi:hypothetical protein
MEPEFNFSAPLRTLVDRNMDVFRYGLHTITDSEFEDPTYLGFTIEIDENSVFFTHVKPFLEKHSSRMDMSSRIPVYDEFVNKIQQVFKSQESVESDNKKAAYVKSHYINTISGFDSLQKKFIKWRADKLTIELYEDIAMYSTYLAHLYNNLVYSYETGRMIIPENLLKFNLYIKISEIRNLTSIRKLKSSDASDRQIADSLKNNVTCLTYKLYDCEFDFFGSKPFMDEITQAGIDAAAPTFSVLTFDLYFKSVSRRMFNPLIKSAISINDERDDLDIIIVGSTGMKNTSGQIPSASSTMITSNGLPQQQFGVNHSNKPNKKDAFLAQTNKKPSDISTYDEEVKKNSSIGDGYDLKSGKEKHINEIKKFNDEIIEYIAETEENSPLVSSRAPFDSGDITGLGNTNSNTFSKDGLKQGLNDLTNKMTKTVENSAKRQLHQMVQDLRAKRNSLVRNFIHDVKNKVGIKTIVPDNVYTDSDYYKRAIEQLKSDVGLTVADGIMKTITKTF